MEQPDLPNWLNVPQANSLPKPRRKRRRLDYLEKTLQRIQQMMMEDRESFRLQNQTAWLQQITPVVKLVAVFLLLIAVAITKDLAFLLLFNLLILLLARQTGIRLRGFLMRVWLPLFLLVGVPLLPGTLSWITPGDTVFTLYEHQTWQIFSFSLPADLAVTKQGVKSALFVLCRAAASLGLTTLLIKTTRWALITQALARVGMPTVLVAVFDLAYRYIYVFLLLLTDYILGRKSRLVGGESQDSKLSWIGSTLAAFFTLTEQYSTEIYDAMRSRGYSGSYPTTEKLSLRLTDSIFLLIVLALCYCAYGGTIHDYFGFI